MKLNYLKGKSNYALKQAVLICCALVIMLAVVERLLRLMNGLRRVDDIPYTLVDGLRVFTPNADTIVTGGAFIPIHVKTNAEGYASPDYPVAAASGTIRIAFLGNSFTRGFEVDYDKKFTSLAEQYLRAQDPGHRYEVMNFGIGGYSFVDQFFAYERYVKKYHPQLVVLVTYPLFDFYTSRVFLTEEPYITKTPTDQLSGDRLLSLEPAYRDTLSATTTTANSRQLELTRFVRRLLAGVTERLHQLSLNQAGVLQQPITILYNQWLRLGLLDASVVKAVTVVDDERAFFNPADNDRLKLMRFTAELTMKLGETVKRNGGKFSVIIIPNYWQVDNKYAKQLAETFPATYDASLPNKIFQQVIGTKFPILDISDRCSKAINDEHIQIFIRDTGHFTAAGHQIVARSIADFIGLKHVLYP